MRKDIIIPAICIILICGGVAVGDTNPYAIPLGSATVDGDISDWATADWNVGTLVTGYWIDSLALPTDVDLSNTKFAARWQTNDPVAGTPGRIYAVAVVDDSSHMFLDEFTEWCATDRVEWFVHGPNFADQKYYKNFYAAQQYVMGVKTSDNSECWTMAGYKKGIPTELGLDLEAAVSVSGDLLIYEASFPVYDSWEGFAGDGTTVNADMLPGVEVGFDLLVGSRKTPYPGTYNTDSYHLLDETGIDCNSDKTNTHKADGLSSVMLEYTLEAIGGDFDLDGDVDVSDLGILATNYGTLSGMTWREGDADGSDGVDVSDLGILATNYGTSTAAAVPEPAALCLLLGALTIVCLFRRR